MIIRVQAISRIMCIIVGSAAIIYRDRLGAATAGLVLVYTFEIAFDAVLFLQSATELYGIAVSLERLYEYTQLPKEVINCEQSKFAQ